MRGKDCTKRGHAVEQKSFLLTEAQETLVTFSNSNSFVSGADVRRKSCQVLVILPQGIFFISKRSNSSLKPCAAERTDKVRLLVAAVPLHIHNEKKTQAV